MIKVHLFYLDNYIYAYTAVKDFAKKFMAQRCMKKLVHRVQKMEDLQWSLFSNKHSNLMLIDVPYDTKTGCITIITTYGEDEAVSHFIERLESAREDCLGPVMRRVEFKPKVDKLLREGLEMIYTTDASGGVGLNISALEIMIYLFEPTFTGEGEIKVPRIKDFTLN